MLDEMTLSKGRVWLGFLSSSRRTSALIASSPRTAYSTLRRPGLSESSVRGRIDDGIREQMCGCDKDLNLISVEHSTMRIGVPTMWRAQVGPRRIIFCENLSGAPCESFYLVAVRVVVLK